jgi:serine/threonine protein kinase
MKEIRPRNQHEVGAALTEAEHLSKLKHQNIIKYEEAFIKGRSVFIVMEFAPRGDLFAQVERCKRNRCVLPEDQIIRWVSDVARALRYIHARGMIHRDIKSANCFVDVAGRVKVGDFGATRELENNHPELGERTCKTPAGTPMYMPPEQVRGQAYGQKADCWSLGCLLYELLTLRHAFYGYSLEQLSSAIKRGRFDRRFPSCYSEAITTLCLNLLKTDPRKRPTIQEVLELKMFGTEEGHASTAVATPEPRPSQPTSSETEVADAASSDTGSPALFPAVIGAPLPREHQPPRQPTLPQQSARPRGGRKQLGLLQDRNRFLQQQPMVGLQNQGDRLTMAGSAALRRLCASTELASRETPGPHNERAHGSGFRRPEVMRVHRLPSLPVQHR